MNPDPWRPNRRELLAALGGLALLATACSSDSKSGSTTAASGTTGTPGTTAADATATTTATSGGGAAEQPVSGGKFTAIHVSNPSTLDPIQGNSGNDHVSLYPFYDRLVNFDPTTLEAKPGLAESWEFTGDQELTLALRQGVKFHDGTDFDATAVKFNLDRSLSDPKTTVRADLAMIASTEVVDPTHLKISLNRPDSSLILILADRPGMMVSPTAVQKSGDDYGRNPVGTGPFSFVEWVPNDHLTGKRNESYWQSGMPYLDQVTIRYIGDSQTGLNSLLAGEADLGMKIDPSSLQTLDSHDDITVSAAPSLGFDSCYLNYSKEPFNKVEVRQAINYAIDRAALNDAYMFGKATPAVEPYPPGYWAAQPDLANAFPYDVAKAKELLTQAGYPNGLTLKGLTYDASSVQRKAEIIQAQLKEAGINVTFDTMEVGAATSSFFENLSHDIYSAGWSGRPDPSQTANSLFATTAFYNPGHLNVPGMDDALAKAGSAQNQTDRAAAFHDVVQLQQDQGLGLILLHQPDINAFYDHVGGFESNLYGKIDVSFLWLKK